MPPKSKKDDEVEKLTRIAVVNNDRCKPRKCTRRVLSWGK
jgi:hypothetical protein